MKKEIEKSKSSFKNEENNEACQIIKRKSLFITKVSDSYKQITLFDIQKGKYEEDKTKRRIGRPKKKYKQSLSIKKQYSFPDNKIEYENNSNTSNSLSINDNFQIPNNKSNHNNNNYIYECDLNIDIPDKILKSESLLNSKYYLIQWKMRSNGIIPEDICINAEIVKKDLDKPEVYYTCLLFKTLLFKFKEKIELSKQVIMDKLDNNASYLRKNIKQQIMILAENKRKFFNNLIKSYINRKRVIKIRKFNFSGNLLGVKGLKYLSFYLFKKDSIIELNLSNNDLEKAQDHLNFLTSLPNLKIIKLENTKLFSKESLSKPIGEIFCNCHNLELLNLNHNHSNTINCLSVLKKKNKLKHLFLSECNLQESQKLMLLIDDLLLSNSKGFLILETLELSKNLINCIGACMIGKVAFFNKSIKNLILYDNLICGKGIDTLLKAITQNNTIEYLDISRNLIEESFIRSLKENVKKLKLLGIKLGEINGNQFPDNLQELLTEIIKGKSIKCLDFNKIQVNNFSGKIINEFIGISNIIELNLSNLYLSFITSFDTFLSSVKLNFQLISLNLSNNQLSTIQPALLCKLFELSLEELDISSNSINFDCDLDTIFEPLSFNIRLKKLNISSNCLSNGIDKILKFLTLNKSLKKLVSKNNQINNISKLDYSANYFKSNLTIEKLDFEGNFLTEEDVIFILDIFNTVQSVNVKKLNLKSNQIKSLNSIIFNIDPKKFRFHLDCSILRLLYKENELFRSFIRKLDGEINIFI